MKKNKTKNNIANNSNSRKRISLLDIKSPSDIKNLNKKELDYLAVEIREFLIDNVSKTGGHLASNLGAVEITLGLHYVFNSPTDKIIWDVGHQAYVHKMLTGRLNAFSGLRKTGGMSGFPKRVESPHDIYDTGHSSTSIPAALGMATARDLSGETYDIIAVIGDGSMTGGPSFEALNNAGNINTKIIILLNDNGMSISKNIGGISEHLGKLRTSTGYQQAKVKVKGKLNQVPVLGSGLKSAIGSTKENIKYMLMPEGVLFEEFGLTYIGPIDGNNINDVITGLNQAKKADGPVLLHMITEKGKGYIPAERDPNVFHGIGPFDKETGAALSSGKTTYSEVFGEALFDVAKYNDRVTAITAAMCDATGLGPMLTEFPERVFDVGIAEAYGVIFAAGQAISGYHPFVAIYSSFLQRAYDEIMEDVCLQKLPVTFAVDRAGVVGADGETHHGVFDLSYLLPMPGLSIFTPCDANELRLMIKKCAYIDAPTAIRYPRGAAEMDLLLDQPIEDDQSYNIRLFDGKDLDLYAVGTMLRHAIDARDLLSIEGIDAGIVYIGMVKDGSNMEPEPETYLLYDKQSNKPIFTIEDNVITGGFGEYLASVLNNNGFNTNNRICNLAWPDKFIEHGDTKDLFNIYKMDAVGICQKVIEYMEKRINENAN